MPFKTYHCWDKGVEGYGVCHTGSIQYRKHKQKGLQLHGMVHPRIPQTPSEEEKGFWKKKKLFNLNASSLAV